ncbi:GNAT family N-acetyltransferase [Lysinimonas soli]|uniref:GNAT family N-acetyltransferase n=1 Tax=Lysinimonas soli TaxID=1074233 RepID=A0ABW0NNA3_9MICO
MSDPILRPYRDDDLDALVAVNDAAYPAVPITPAVEFAELVAMSSVRLVVDDGRPAGFLLGMPPGLDYRSENYLFFSARSDDFVYVDRIVLSPHLQGRGIGPRLYEAAFAEARRVGASEVLCEVNLEPPNPGSLAFHSRLGFVEVGRQSTKGGANIVALLAAPVGGNLTA